MTWVCLVGDDDVNLQYELLSRETSRAALAVHDVEEPFVNTVAVEMVSLGSAVALMNDLNWYLVRFADDVIVSEPSISTDEWFSRGLAEEVRDGEVAPEDTGRLLKMYGVVDDRLVEPMYVARTDGTTPTYDLRDVDRTLVVRVTEGEFEG